MRRVVRPGFIYTLAALFSLFLSAWAASKAYVINPDGICYLQSAATLSQGLTLATHVCEQANWPFYSILIFGFAKFSGLSYLLSAFTLNALFSLITVLMFIAITRQLTSSARIVSLAALVILFAHEFNGVRADVIRDHGFWAFYLMSLYFFLRYLRGATPAFFSALLWSGTMMTAALFRVEGGMFLLLLPFAVLLDTSRGVFRRLLAFLQLNTLTIVAVAALSIWITRHGAATMGRLPEIQFQLLHGFQTLLQHFYASAQELAQHVLSEYSQHDAASMLFIMLCGWYLTSVVNNVSLIYTVLIIYAWVKRLSGFDHPARLALWAYIFVNVIITFAFLINHLFLAKRYLIALSLVLMLWVPFALEHLIQQWRQRKWPLILALILIAASALGGIVEFGYSKKYIREAGNWLAANTSQQAKIYSNDYQVLYYSQHFGNDIFARKKEFADMRVIAKGKWRAFDYVALRTSKKDTADNTKILQEFNFTPVAVFQNKRADQVRIYRVVHH